MSHTSGNKAPTKKSKTQDKEFEKVLKIFEKDNLVLQTPQKLGNFHKINYNLMSHMFYSTILCYNWISCCNDPYCIIFNGIFLFFHKYFIFFNWYYCKWWFVRTILFTSSFKKFKSFIYCQVSHFSCGLD